MLDLINSILEVLGLLRSDDPQPDPSRLWRSQRKLERLSDHLRVEDPGLEVIPADVHSLWVNSSRRKAVRRYSELTGLSRKDAKVKLQASFDPHANLEATIDRLLRNQGLDTEVSEDAPPGVTEALLNGKKIQAVKLYMDATGAELTEAKDFVDALQLRLPSA